MQAIAPVTDADLLHPVQRMLFRFEVHDGSEWIDLTDFCELSPLPGWLFRKFIVIQPDYIDATLTDFPLLVEIDADSDIGAMCQATGHDIRFTAADGVTLLKYERESFSVTGDAATGVFWVKLPALTPGLKIYIYWGNADAADGADPENVWDSNFKAVYHMKDATTSTVLDSTANNNDGTKKGANEPVEATGKVGKGQDFDGSDDYIGVTDHASLDITSALTIEAWINRDAQTPDWPDLVGKGQNYYLGLNKAESKAYFSAVISSTQYYRYFDTATVEGAWVHLVATYDSATGVIACYRNGISNPGSANEPAATTLLTANNDAIGIGGTAAYYTGLIDEVRISSTARSAAWIKFEYYNMASDAGEVEFMAEQTLTENYLQSITVTPSGAGPTPEVIAGTWSAEIANPDGIFAPYHPTSSYTDYFRIGRKVRVSVGTTVSGTAYYWQRIIGYMDEPRFDFAGRKISVSGTDYMKALADTKLYSPYTQWGDSATFDSEASPGGSGTEIYDEADACEIGAGEANNVTNWTASASASVASVVGEESNYALQLTRSVDGPDEVYCYNSECGSITSGNVYQITFYAKVTGDGYGYVRAYQTISSTDYLLGQVAVGGSDWTLYLLRVTALATAHVELRVISTGQYAASGDTVLIDEISIKRYNPEGWADYELPLTATGIYYLTLDGAPVWHGDEDGNGGWHFEDDPPRLFFSEEMVIEDGTANLVVYYFEPTLLDDVVADLLVAGHLYSSRALAKAAMDYTPTGISLDKIWFKSGMSALDAMKMICERADYRFWFAYDGTPNFHPAPDVDDTAVFTFSSVGDFGGLSLYQDLSAIKNSIIVEGMERSVEPGTQEKPTTFSASASDTASINAYQEKTYHIKNHLFQDQTSVDDMASDLLADYKDPKWYLELTAPFSAVPLEVGDTVSVAVPTTSTASAAKLAIVRSLSLSQFGLTAVCELGGGE